MVKASTILRLYELEFQLENLELMIEWTEGEEQKELIAKAQSVYLEIEAIEEFMDEQREKDNNSFECQESLE